MGKTLLFGEPMALLIADSTGKLEDVDKFTRSLSGAEVNVAIGLSRLGHEVTYLTRLGNDPFGIYIKNTLEKNNIGTEFVTFDNIYKTGIQLKNRVVDGSNPYAPYYRRGSAASHITPMQIDMIDFSNVEHVHITGIPPALSKTSREATYRLFERAKEKNIFITFDPNLRPSLWESEETMIKVINDLATKADLILPGISECNVLTGFKDFDDIADFYQNKGVMTIIIKDGANGSYIRDGSETYKVNGFKVKNVVDTVGAGDGFAVGVISGRLEGLSLREMVTRGNAIGAIQVTDISDNAALPNHEELKLFINNYK